MLLACIAHKSLEICERCRLWQRNSPAEPENSAAFGDKSFKTLCLDSLIFEEALKQSLRVCASVKEQALKINESNKLFETLLCKRQRNSAVASLWRDLSLSGHAVARRAEVVSGVAGEICCYSLHRSQISKDL